MLNSNLQLPTFRSAQNLVYGKNSIMSLRGIESSRVALISSKSILSNKFLKNRILSNLRYDKLEIIEKSWKENFNKSDIRESLKVLENLKPDVILAVGGGSVIDASKIIWLFYENPDLYYKDEISISDIKLRGKSRFIAMPSTVGSGSEVSSSCIFYDEISKSKKAIVSHEFLPDLSVLDPYLIKNLPKETLILSACDALTHSIEGFVSRIENKFMDSFAIQCTKTILSLENIPEEINIDLAEKLQRAAVMGGWVQNHCLTGGSHAIAHQLAKYDIPHANAVSIMLPAVIKLNSRDEEAKKKYVSFSKEIGYIDSEELVENFIKFRNSSNCKVSLTSYSKELNLIDILQGTIVDPSYRTNPTLIDKNYVEEAIEICS
tara:strand:- start:2237 stop:3367 length:1131 start_codon:yes stop_codon:yes gene_type:complete